MNTRGKPHARPRCKPKRDWIHDWLEDWAHWQENVSGYSSSTVIARIVAGGLGVARGQKDGFGSSPPIGSEPPAHLRRLTLTMADCLANREQAKYIQACQLYYLLGSQGVEAALQRPERTIRRWCRRGEDILRNEMRK